MQYRSELANRPPVTPFTQEQRMAEMQRYAPAGQGDVFNAGLNLPAFQRAAEDANRNYKMKNQSILFGLAGAGLGDMAQQQGQREGMQSSLLGSLLRRFT